MYFDNRFSFNIYPVAMQELFYGKILQHKKQKLLKLMKKLNGQLHMEPRIMITMRKISVEWYLYKQCIG